jgi:hypothetical protein
LTAEQRFNLLLRGTYANSFLQQDYDLFAELKEMPLFISASFAQIEKDIPRLKCSAEVREVIRTVLYAYAKRNVQ